MENSRQKKTRPFLHELRCCQIAFNIEIGGTGGGKREPLEHGVKKYEGRFFFDDSGSGDQRVPAGASGCRVYSYTLNSLMVWAACILQHGCQRVLATKTPSSLCMHFFHGIPNEVPF